MSAAVVTRDRSDAGRNFVESAMTALRPRGPDASGTRHMGYRGWEVWLGHNRLSVIDLSSRGNQPMERGQPGMTIVYNGEVYNFREIRSELETQGSTFTSQSDTEVLLHAWARWGPDAVERFNGMFAFALWDPAAGELVLVRDRFGIKPLHFVVTPSTLHVASTPEPLAHLAGRRPDLDYVLRGLAQRVYEQNDEASPYEGVRSVRPGHLYRFQLGPDRITETQHQYYDLRSRVALAKASNARSDSEWIEKFRTLFASACSLRTRSDVPVAVSLSGGLDSGSVALHAAKTADLRGFSFADRGVPESEGRLVEATAGRTGIPVEFVWPPPEKMAELFWECLTAQQAPFLTGSVIGQFAVFRRARELGYKVLLGGQGGDEAFMGYRKYHLFALQESWRSPGRRGLFLSLLQLAMVGWAERGQVGVYGRRAAQYFRFRPSQSLFDLRQADQAFIGLRAEDRPWERQLLDVTRFSLPTLLRYEDRNSAGNSVESRLPFLDFRLLEQGLALPPSLKLRKGFGKWILREMVADALPREIVWGRTKRGFDVDPSTWIRSGLGKALRERLEDGIPTIRSLLSTRVQPHRHFSDRELISTPGRFGDAVTAVWLSTRL